MGYAEGMAVKTPVYLDYHATTPCDERVIEAMLPYFCERFGNAASRSHSFGWAAEKAVDQARAQVARLIGATPREVIFTSGATESDNLALKGVAEAYRSRGNHILTLTIEHSAVLDTCRWLEGQGCSISRLPVEKDGRVDLARLEAAFTPQTILVSIMAANNEIGVVQDMEAIGRLCRSRGVLLHTDATQAAGKIPVDVERWQVDLASLSGHKMYGPKGVGALYVRQNPKVELACQQHGGGHERGMRSGTLNVPAIVGLGKAAEIAMAEMGEESVRLAGLRDRLLAGIRAQIPDVQVNGSLEHRLPNNLHLTFSGVDGETLMMSMSDLAVSSGSACTSAKMAASHVLRALGLNDDEAHRSLRFGLGRWTSAEEIEFAIGRVTEAVQQLRSFAAR